jgi:hypothetical protein
MRDGERPARLCTSRTGTRRAHTRGDLGKRVTAIYWGQVVAGSNTVSPTTVSPTTVSPTTVSPTKNEQFKGGFREIRSRPISRLVGFGDVEH